MTSHLVIFKGGTAFNSLLESFKVHFPKSSYVVPISDDGGSSREICRVFGGPSIGDLRSTLTRLSCDLTDETRAVRRLLEYRLSPHDEVKAASEWYELLEDRHPIYEHISSQYRGLLRCFLCKFEAERLQRISCRFDLRNGSVGNFFFTGARLVLGSLETAIFVYSSVARIAETTRVLPIVDTMDRLLITAELQDGTHISGQHAISHPSHDHIVSKEPCTPLPAAISKLFYVNKYGDEHRPQLNRSVHDDLKECQGIIYGIGSLWTSIIPSLILHGVGSVIASRGVPKVLLLNSYPDRETMGLTALDFITHIARALDHFGASNRPITDYLTHLIAIEDSKIALDEMKIKNLGIELVKLPKDQATNLYNGPILVDALTKIIRG